MHLHPRCHPQTLILAFPRKDEAKVNNKKFTAAGGTSSSGTRTIGENWTYVDITWLVKVKTDSAGDVHFEAWSQPHGERTVLTLAL